MRTKDEEDEEGDPLPKDGKHFPDQKFFYIMPIVNGKFVNGSLLGPEAAQQQVFGEYIRNDMADYSAAAYNYLMKQQEQAYNLELWNLQNEYNSPSSQMKRFQDAGLNPNLIYGQQNLASSPAGAQAPTFRSSGVAAKHNQNAIGLIGQIMNVVKSARDTYDYMRYGSQQHAWDIVKTQAEGERLSLDNIWQRWFIGRGDDNVVPPDTPRRLQWQQQLDNMTANYDRIKALIELIPDQQARIQSLKALDDYRLGIMKGQNDAILNIQTGYPALDAWLKMLSYFGMSQF